MMAKRGAKGKVVEASLAAGASAGFGPSLGSSAIEDAMNQATLDALADGIVDPEEILKLKLAARERVKSEHAKAVAAFEKENQA